MNKATAHGKDKDGNNNKMAKEAKPTVSFRTRLRTDSLSSNDSFSSGKIC